MAQFTSDQYSIMRKGLGDYRIQTKSKKWRDTGWRGKQVERKIGIKENNSKVRDLDFAEVKSVNGENIAMLTMFTKKPDVCYIQEADGADIVKSIIAPIYGYRRSPNAKARLANAMRFGYDPNAGWAVSNRWHLALSEDRRYLMAVVNEHTPVCGWELEALTDTVREKLTSVAVYFTSKEWSDGTHVGFVAEWAEVLSDFDHERFAAFIEAGGLQIEFAVGSHNRGTKFRAKLDVFRSLYRTREVISIDD